MTRIALYSHDSQGLGHVRRSLALAGALHTADSGVRTLILAGAEESGALPRPPGCDVVGVPSLHKDLVGGYRARRLGIPLADLLDLRGAVMAAALASFSPDVVVVDRYPRGFRGELVRGLSAVPATTRVVLGLRDVIDAPHVAASEWAADGGTQALDRWYDEVWVYGDTRVHDCVAALGLPMRWRERVRWTGYLVPRPPALTVDPPSEQAGRVLCLVGGGSDGRFVAEAFARSQWPAGEGLLVLGPQMAPVDRAAVRMAAGQRTDLEIRDFETDLAGRLSGARAAVTMGGYNTVCELLAHRVPALIVPRVSPRCEQFLRARRMAELGLVDLMHPSAVTAGRLSDWLHGPRCGTGRGQVPSDASVDLDGLAVVPRLVRRLAARDGNRPEVVRAAH